MFKKLRYLFVIITTFIFIGNTYTQAAVRNKGDDLKPVKIVSDSEYIEGKINDPVSKETKNAFIVSDNPIVHFVSEPGNDGEFCQVILYCNEYINGQDIGVHRRIFLKDVEFGEALSLLPEDLYDKITDSTKSMNLVNRCYDLRVYYNKGLTDYIDYYFGFVNSAIYEEMYTDKLEKEVEETQQSLISSNKH